MTGRPRDVGRRNWSMLEVIDAEPALPSLGFRRTGLGALCRRAVCVRGTPGAALVLGAQRVRGELPGCRTRRGGRRTTARLVALRSEQRHESIDRGFGHA